MDMALHKTSIRLIQSPTNELLYFLTFKFDLLVNTIITLYWVVQEKKDNLFELTSWFGSSQSHTSLLSFFPRDKSTPSPISFPYEPRMNSIFLADLSAIDLGALNKDVFKNITKFKQDEYGLVIRMEKVDRKQKSKKILYSYC